MRPRHDGRGNQLRGWATARRRGASMRPRHDGRGNWFSCKSPRLARKSFNEAAPRWARKLENGMHKAVQMWELQ